MSEKFWFRLAAMACGTLIGIIVIVEVSRHMEDRLLYESGLRPQVEHDALGNRRLYWSRPASEQF